MQQMVAGLGFFYKELPRKPELLRENLTPMSTFITLKVATVPPFQKSYKSAFKLTQT